MYDTILSDQFVKKTLLFDFELLHYKPKGQIVLDQAIFVGRKPAAG